MLFFTWDYEYEYIVIHTYPHDFNSWGQFLKSSVKKLTIIRLSGLSSIILLYCLYAVSSYTQYMDSTYSSHIYTYTVQRKDSFSVVSWRMVFSGNSLNWFNILEKLQKSKMSGTPICDFEWFLLQCSTYLLVCTTDCVYFLSIYSLLYWNYYKICIFKNVKFSKTKTYLCYKIQPLIPSRIYFNYFNFPIVARKYNISRLFIALFTS